MELMLRASGLGFFFFLSLRFLSGSVAENLQYRHTCAFFFFLKSSSWSCFFVLFCFLNVSHEWMMLFSLLEVTSLVRKAPLGQTSFVET